MLDVAEEILNRCTKLSPEYEVTKDIDKVAFIYEFIEDAQPQTERENVTVKNPDANNNQTGDIISLQATVR
jgi:hypothetical protein